jgi:trehalose-phosphatase
LTAPALPFTAELARRLSGEPLVLLLDIDGTLAPIAPRPEMAVVPLETRRVLATLARLRGVRIGVISGRAASDAARLVGVDGAWVIGNHGFEVLRPGANPAPRPDAIQFADAVAQAAERLEKIAARYPGAVVENKKWTLSVHYRLVDRREAVELIGIAEGVAAESGLRAIRGKEVIELRPPLPIDKGTAALALARQFGALDPNASLLCAGDDVTDEDAFSALRAVRSDYVTVCVHNDAHGPSNTAAEFTVPDTEALRDLLTAMLVGRRRQILG